MICLIITTIYLSEIKENGKFTVSQKKSCQNVCLMAFINKQIPIKIKQYSLCCRLYIACDAFLVLFVMF